MPFRCPAGGLPSLSPVYPALCLLSCPHPPYPPSRREGGDFCYLIARGFAPCIPGAGRDAALVRRALAAPGGGLPGWSPNNLAILMPSGCLPGWSPVLPAVPAPGGGLAVFVACLPCLLLAFLPPSPYPRSQSALPGGKGGSKVILCKGLRPLHPPGLAGRGTGLVLRKQFGLVSPEDAGYSYSQ